MFAPPLALSEPVLACVVELFFAQFVGVDSSEPARRFGVSHSRISDLTRGKIDRFSIDTLVNMLTAAGLHLDLRVREARWPAIFDLEERVSRDPGTSGPHQ